MRGLVLKIGETGQIEESRVMADNQTDEQIAGAVLDRILEQENSIMPAVK
jgi:hypothetical protein